MHRYRSKCLRKQLYASGPLLAWRKLYHKPLLASDLSPDKTIKHFSSNIVFVAHNMGWLSEQTMFDQISSKASSRNAFCVLPLEL